MARCGLCRKEIRRAFNTEGRLMDVDFRPHPEGTVWLYPRDHQKGGRLRVLSDEEVERAKKAGYPLYRKHLGSCPAMAGKDENQMEMSL